VLAFSLAEASAKLRTGGPNDDPEDADLPTWTGVVPMQTVRLTPIQREGEQVPLPDYLR
jgi:uncharacterized protein